MSVSSAYRVSDGRVGALVLPFIVPEPIRARGADGELVPVCLLAGREHDHFAGTALPLVFELAARVVPWATLYFAPFWTGCSVAATTWCGAEVAVVRNDLDPHLVLEATLHEAWHLSEEMIAPELLAELDRQLATGASWPYADLAQPCERRARAFQHVAMAMMEGCRMTVAGPSAPPEIDLFWRVFNGDLGREVVAARAPRRRGLLRRAADALSRRF